MVHGPVREVVRGPSPLDWSTDRGSVFSGHPCCSVDWGRTIPGAGHLPSSLVPTTGHLAAKVSPPPGICHPREKKCLCPGVSPGGGRGMGAVGID